MSRVLDAAALVAVERAHRANVGMTRFRNAGLLLTHVH